MARDRNVCALCLIKTKDVFHFTNIVPIPVFYNFLNLLLLQLQYRWCLKEFYNICFGGLENFQFKKDFLMTAAAKFEQGANPLKNFGVNCLSFVSVFLVMCDPSMNEL